MLTCNGYVCHVSYHGINYMSESTASVRHVAMLLGAASTAITGALYIDGVKDRQDMLEQRLGQLEKDAEQFVTFQRDEFDREREQYAIMQNMGKLVRESCLKGGEG